MKQVRFLRKAATPPEVKLPEGSRRTPPEVKLSEGSRRKRRTPFLREEAEGRAFFKTSSESRRTRFFQNKFASFGFLRKAATPPEVKLSEGSEGRRQR